MVAKNVRAAARTLIPFIHFRFVLFFKFAINNWIGKRDKGGPNVNDVPVKDDAAKAEGGEK